MALVEDRGQQRSEQKDAVCIQFLLCMNAKDKTLLQNPSPPLPPLAFHRGVKAHNKSDPENRIAFVDLHSVVILPLSAHFSRCNYITPVRDIRDNLKNAWIFIDPETPESPP